MRDLLVLAVILGSVPICLFNPYYGVLMWTWIAYFNPHRFTWGMAYHFPVAEVVAVPTLVGTLFARKLNRWPFTRETILLLLLWAWFVITLVYAAQVPELAGHIQEGQLALERVSKILLMTVWAVLLVSSWQRVRYLFLLIAFSIGALALKGAIFGLRTGGGSLVWGPPESFLANNNDLGLAVAMALPMFFYLARNEENRLLRWILRILFLCGILCVILTYSRGAMLGLAVVLAVIAVKSRRKLISFFLLLVCAWLVFSFAPEAWMGRMSAFLGGQLDNSARSRLWAWSFAWNLAQKYPVTGGGFEAFNANLFRKYAAPPVDPRYEFQGPHSIYFQMLGEQGFVGLGLFLLLLVCCLLALRKIRRRVRSHDSPGWLVNYSHMLETSFLAYMVSGAFLGRAYFDLAYQLVASTIILKILWRREIVPSPAKEAEPIVVGAEEGVVT